MNKLLVLEWPTFTDVYSFTVSYTLVLTHTGKGKGGRGEKVTGALVHKRGRKYQHD